MTHKQGERKKMLQRRGDRLELYRLKDGGLFGRLEPLDSGLDSGPRRRTVSGLPCATPAPCSNEILWSASAMFTVLVLPR
jgi:hypothetical protein